ncbi:uncharacterized protein B0H18DRAFT_26596 [Fomitopsis serialis]|uniref:uncharacterized protein n=1 Tax=Fomitopsis serialis TaxID=139415 RepID=UPI002008675F|nr:uncharacterized protein B0H18DRAFT_26596 [Neoantrodia serialis]KAH9932477.1 hypothetical protein B0H18DRAFT_26596 [Neoantrodia serialis]
MYRQHSTSRSSPRPAAPPHPLDRDWRYVLPQYEYDIRRLPDHGCRAIQVSVVAYRGSTSERSRRNRRDLLHKLFNDLHQVDRRIVMCWNSARDRSLRETTLRFHRESVVQRHHERLRMIQCFVESFDGLVCLENWEAISMDGVRRPEADVQNYRDELLHPLVSRINYLLDLVHGTDHLPNFSTSRAVYRRLRKEVRQWWTIREGLPWVYRSPRITDGA